MLALKLLFRNAFRHRMRTLLTVAGVAIAILAFGLLRTLIGAWYQGVEASSATRLITRNAISLVFPLPLSYLGRIRQVPGVKTVSYGNWFGGVYIDRKNFFPNFAVDADTYLDMYPEFVLPPAEKAAFIRDRRGAVAGSNLARKYGWTIGDRITLKGTIFPGNWDLVLRGIYHGARRSTDRNQFFFHWDYLNETMKKNFPRRADQVGFFVIGVKSPERAAEVSEVVDGMFRNSLAETLTETEKAFQMGFISMSEAIVIAIRIVSYVVIVIIMVVAANTMAMTARERIAEYATMKTLGFGARHIAQAVFGESLFISLTGGLLGILLTYPAARYTARLLEQFFPVFHVASSTVWLDLAAAAAVGVVAGIFPTWRGATIRVAEGLRRIG
jgi:putative ABC transport system permease protein